MVSAAAMEGSLTHYLLENSAFLALTFTLVFFLHFNIYDTLPKTFREERLTFYLSLYHASLH